MVPYTNYFFTWTKICLLKNGLIITLFILRIKKLINETDFIFDAHSLGMDKQRPHFFAEKLAKDIIVDVKYKQPFKVAKKHLLTSKSETISNLFIGSFLMFPFYKLPILRYFTWGWIQSLSLKLSLKKKGTYDFIWLTSPALYPSIGCVNSDAKIIYDCMDDIAEFPSSKSSPVYCKQLINWEMDLMKQADIVLCSSEYLKEKSSRVLESTGRFILLIMQFLYLKSDILIVFLLKCKMQ